MEITKDKITEIFCIIDDFCQEYDKEIARMSICEPDGRKHRNRKCTMSRSEIMTILICFLVQCLVLATAGHNVAMVYCINDLFILAWQLVVGIDELYHQIFFHGKEYARFQIFDADKFAAGAAVAIVAE